MAGPSKRKTPPVHEQVTARGDTALLLAVKYGHLDLTQLLLRQGFAVNARDANGLTPLAVACATGQGQTISTLISAHADPNIRDRDERNAMEHLLLSAGKNRCAVVALLSAPNLTDKDRHAAFQRLGFDPQLSAGVCPHAPVPHAPSPFHPYFHTSHHTPAPPYPSPGRPVQRTWPPRDHRDPPQDPRTLAQTLPRLQPANPHRLMEKILQSQNLGGSPAGNPPPTYPPLVHVEDEAVTSSKPAAPAQAHPPGVLNAMAAGIAKVTEEITADAQDLQNRYRPTTKTTETGDVDVVGDGTQNAEK